MKPGDLVNKMKKVEPGQLRQWTTTGRMLLIISPVSGCSNWMVLKQTHGIDYFSESVLELTTRVVE